MPDIIEKPFSWNSEWSKSEVKRENSDLCKTKKVIKQYLELKKST